MSFRSFGGEFTRGTRISLSGKSRQEESREQVLERTRKEREKRKQVRLENKSATVIQAAWRTYYSRRITKAEIKAEWLSRYGNDGERASSADLSSDSPYIRQLCYFINPANAQDLILLAAGCRLALVVAPIKQPQLCAAAAASPEAAPIISRRACKLVSLCIDCLFAQVGVLGDHLAAPRHVAPAPGLPAAASVLVETAISLVSPESWGGALDAQGSARAAAQILHHSLQRNMFRKLAVLLSKACTAGSRKTGVPAIEALCTAFVVRYFSIPASKRLELRVAHDFGPSILACIPLLLERCPSLSPLVGLLWKEAVGVLHDMPAASLTSWLPNEPSLGPPAIAAAALLGNAVEWANTALGGGPDGGSKTQVAAKRIAALQFVKLVTTLLSLLPLVTFFPGEREVSVRGDDDDDQGLRAMQAAAGAPKLAWDAEDLPPSDLVTQMHKLVADPAVVQACVRAALPAASIDTATPCNDADALKQAADAARAVCGFITMVLQLPGAATSWLLSSAGFAQRLWFSYLRAAHSEGSGSAWLPSDDGSIDPGWMLPVALFSEAFSTSLAIFGDEGLYDNQQPLPLTELYSDARQRGSVLPLLRFALWHTLWVEAPPVPGGWSPQAAALRTRLCQSAGRLISQLHSRNGRRQFAPREAFYAESLPVERFQAEIAAGAMAGRDSEDPGASRAWGLLAHAPCLLPFKERARVFQSLVTQERAQYRADDAFLFTGMHNTRQFITVRRGQVLNDAFVALGTGSGSDQLRGRVRVRFLSEQGLEEAGVDGGGIFKEFLGEVVREGFDPEVGLFKATTDNRMYPNPQAAQLVPGAMVVIEFLGRMIGKAMWEGILLELPLAYFFLKKFRGAVCDVDDLPTLDPELHRHLLSLKSYSGDVADLGLSFTITNEAPAGGTEEVELIPGGRDIAVTSGNAMAYIRRVADYRLNVQLREATSAFMRGLHALVPAHWVSMFNERELQELLSGAEGRAGIDVTDLKANVQYSGGYHEDHPIVHQFWLALETFTPEEQGELLRFVTSCPRPPLLGFRYLEPPFCIQMAGSVTDPTSTERLPTASTCMNLLKLPPYRTSKQIREKLLYAVSAGAGFELS